MQQSRDMTATPPPALSDLPLSDCLEQPPRLESSTPSTQAPKPKVHPLPDKELFAQLFTQFGDIPLGWVGQPKDNGLPKLISMNSYLCHTGAGARGT